MPSGVRLSEGFGLTVPERERLDMLKKLELSTPTSCLNKAAPDEPVFVLRAKDALAAMTVRHWITMAEGLHEPAKLEEARKLAETMEQWRARNVAMPADMPSAA